METSRNRHVYDVFVIFLAVIISGCTVSERPRARMGSYAGSFASFTDADSLGHHNFSSFVGERNGVAYTARGGHIDIAHLRIAADNVYYLNNLVSNHLKAGDTEFTYKLNTDPAVFKVRIEYPLYLKMLSESEQKRILDEVSLEMSQYFAWQMVSWHEVLTWFGLTFYGLPQFNSAFSWEDNYSNLLGIILGGRAAGDRSNNFNDAMTNNLKGELGKLGIQPASIAKSSSEKMRGKWFTDNKGVKVLMRNMDLGLDDGYVSPVLVPGICSDSLPLLYPVPRLKSAANYGFVVDLEINNSGSAGHRCLDIIYPDGRNGPIHPSKDLPAIMLVARNQAIEKGFDVVPKTQQTEFEPMLSDRKLNADSLIADSALR